MRTDMTSLVFIYLWITITGASVTTTTGLSQNNHKCSSDVFKECTDKFTSLVNIKSDVIDTKALMQFYCSPNYTVTINCLRDHLDPSCGPDTYAYIWNRTLAAIPADFSYDKYCHNDSAKELEKLLQCQTKFSKVQGYIDCSTGGTLNKTIDPTDLCNFLKTTMGCAYKYSQLMCQSSTRIFNEFARTSMRNCDIDFESSDEATVCDRDMEKACVVAYNPPPVNRKSSQFTKFICSERGRGLQQCLRTVYDMCKDISYFNSSPVNKDIQNYKDQTAMFCSDSTRTVEQTTVTSTGSYLGLSLSAFVAVVCSIYFQNLV